MAICRPCLVASARDLGSRAPTSRLKDNGGQCPLWVKSRREPVSEHVRFYDGYFADPDGHVWEVAFSPYWELDGNGRVRLPD